MRFYCLHLPAVIGCITVHLRPVATNVISSPPPLKLCNADSTTAHGRSRLRSARASVPPSNYLVPPSNIFFSVHQLLPFGSTLS